MIFPNRTHADSAAGFVCPLPMQRIYRAGTRRCPCGKMTSIALRCILVIRSFKHRGLKRLYERGDRGGIRPDLRDAVQEIMTILDGAATPQALNLPGYRLHPLKGELKGFWSVTVRANWRIVFRFEANDAFDVELADYH